MMYNKLTKKIAVAAISTAALLAGAVQAVAGDWKPQKPVELVIMAGQG